MASKICELLFGREEVRSILLPWLVINCGMDGASHFRLLHYVLVSDSKYVAFLFFLNIKSHGKSVFNFATIKSVLILWSYLIR